MNPVCHFELEVLPGLEPLALEECSRHGVSHVALKEKGKLFARFSPDHLSHLLALKLVASAHVVVSVPGKRPSTLRGHQALATLAKVVSKIRLENPFETQTCRFGMQGSGSPEALRIREEIARGCQLTENEESGEHLFRLRRSLYLDGWDVVIRVTPRPLSTRRWRTVDYRGALHANIAAAMATLCLQECQGEKGHGTRVILDPFCGSGSLLCEVSEAVSEPVTLIGNDISSEALKACRANAAGITSEFVEDLILYTGDATSLPLADGTIDAIHTNLPWGEVHGQLTKIEELYAHFLTEAHRVLKAGGVLILCTQAVEKLHRVIEPLGSKWALLNEMKVFNGSFRPTVLTLKKNHALSDLGLGTER